MKLNELCKRGLSRRIVNRFFKAVNRRIVRPMYDLITKTYLSKNYGVVPCNSSLNSTPDPNVEEKVCRNSWSLMTESWTAIDHFTMDITGTY